MRTKTADAVVTKREWLGPGLLALLTCVGQLKENPLLQWMPEYLTLIVTALVAVMMLSARAKMGPTTGRVMMPVVLWALFIPAVALSNFSDYSTTKITTLFTVTLVLAVAPFYLLREERQRTAFIYILAGISVVVTLLALLGQSTSAEYTNRLTLEGANTIGTARISMAGAVVLALCAFQRGMRPIIRIGMIGLAGSTATLGVLSGSRGPVIAGVVAILAVIVFAPSMRAYRVRALVSAVLLGGVVVWIALQNRSDGLNRIMTILLGDSDSSSSIRSSLWQSGIEDMQDIPFGKGWGGYANENSIYRYPHNLPVEIGLEAGWFVLAVFLLLVIATLIRGVRVATTITGTVILGLFVFSLINTLVSADINGTRLFWPVLFAIWVMRTNDEEPWFYSRTAARRISETPVYGSSR